MYEATLSLLRLVRGSDIEVPFWLNIVRPATLEIALPMYA